jgi:hypothetical protein
MAYGVSLSALAEADAYAAFERIREAAPMYAEKWLVGLFAAIPTPDETPLVALLFLKPASLAFRPGNCCMAKAGESTASFFTSGKRSNMSAYCASGTVFAMPSLLMIWNRDPIRPCGAAAFCT